MVSYTYFHNRFWSCRGTLPVAYKTGHMAAVLNLFEKLQTFLLSPRIPSHGLSLQLAILKVRPSKKRFNPGLNRKRRSQHTHQRPMTHVLENCYSQISQSHSWRDQKSRSQPQKPSVWSGNQPYRAVMWPSTATQAHSE